MRVLRHCLRCGRDERADSETCSSCGRSLAAWASEPDTSPVGSARRSGGRLRLVGVALALVLAAALAWAVRDLLRVDESDPAASWRRPASVAAWAAERYTVRQAAPRRLRALVETRTSRPQRLLLISHAPELSERAAVRAAAEVLLAARGEGERLLTDAVLLELGPEGERRSLLVPVQEAARLLVNEPAMERILAGARPGRLPALAEALALEPAPGAAAGASEPAASSGAASSEPAAVDDEPEESGRPPEPAAAPGPAIPDPSAPPGSAAVTGGGAAVPAPGASASAPAKGDDGGEPARTEAGTPLDDARAPATRPLPVSLHRGPGRRPSQSYEAGEQGAVLLHVTLSPLGRRQLILRSLTVQAQGTLEDVQGIDFLHLVHDVDRNGYRDDVDRQLGDLTSFVDDDGPATFDDLELSFGGDGQAVNLLVIVDFLDRTEGGTLMLMIPDSDSVVVEEVASGSLVQVNGAPLNGYMTTLNGDLEPDPFQAELDRLAAEE